MAKGLTTQFPSALAIAATWDKDASYLYGKTMANEFSNKGAKIQFAPEMQLARIPSDENNNKFISGEDPFLGYMLSKPIVQGIQSEKIMASAKHFLGGGDLDQQILNSQIDERTRYEMYYEPF